METILGKGFVEQFLKAIMNQEPTGFLCNFGIQYITGKLLSLFPLEIWDMHYILSYLEKFLPEFHLVFQISFSSAWITISFKITVIQYFLHILAILLAALSVRIKAYFLCISFKYSTTASCFNTGFVLGTFSDNVLEKWFYCKVLGNSFFLFSPTVTLGLIEIICSMLQSKPISVSLL